MSTAPLSAPQKPKRKNTLLARLWATILPTLPPLLGLALILGLGYGFWSLGAHNPAAPVSKPRPDDQIGIRFFNVELRGRKNGTPFFSIFADQIEVSRDNRYVFFQGKKKPHGEFYNLKDWEGEFSSELIGGGAPRPRNLRWEAERAEYDYSLENLMMYDKVKIISDGGDVVETDEMFWSKQEESLKSSTRSRVLTSRKTYFEADKLDVKTRAKEMLMEGKVYIEMNVGSDQRIDVEASDQ